MRPGKQVSSSQKWQWVIPTSCPVSWRSSIRVRAESRAGTDAVEPERRSRRHCAAVLSRVSTAVQQVRIQDEYRANAGSSQRGVDQSLGWMPPLADSAELRTLNRRTAIDPHALLPTTT
jgi:hypothetical protein